jgi:diguanylate cyclase (GGDEF)-like protein/PAS domain S-box-containing protein
MQVLVFSATVFFTFTLFLAGYIFYKKPRESVNRLFLVLCLPVAVWCFGYIFMTSAPSKASATFWFRVMALGWYVPVPLLLHLVLALTENNFFKKHDWFYFIIYLPAFVLTYIDAVMLIRVKEFIHTNFGWIYIIDLDSPWMIFEFVFVIIYILAILFLLFRIYYKTSRVILKRQCRVIILTIVISLLAYIVVTYLPVILDTDHITYLDIVTIQIWEIGLSYAIIKYGFMVISPETAAPSILSTMADGLLIINFDGKIIDSNRALHEILALEEESITATNVESLLPEAFVNNKLWEKLSSEGVIRDMETVYLAAGGREVYLSLSASPVSDKFGQRSGYIVLLRDISERKVVEKQLQYLATHDPLTNLPNRTVLNDRLHNALARAKRHDLTVGIVLIDVDHFKGVNDRFGHDCGDMLLKEIADRLRFGVRDYDTVTRMGGDEFVIILSDLTDQNDCLAIINRIRSQFSRPIPIGQQEITTCLSMGVSFYPHHTGNIDDLFKYADIALYHVKDSGRNNYHFYSPEIDAVARKKLKLEQELQKAITGDQFVLYYQPIYNTRSGKLTSLEALIRWKHPKLGLLYPLDFIPIAEKSGTIIPLGEWVLNKSCRQQKLWEEQGLAQIPITVNISAKQFQDPELVSKIEQALTRWNIEPHYLELELTESTAMVEVERTIKTLQQLREKGVSIIIDDFGSGYSSMSWLKQLKIQSIKIGRFFIQNIAQDPHDAAIVKAIVSMAHSLGIKVVAEGVETEGQLEILRSMRWDISKELICDSVQGFLYSKPVPAEAITELLEQDLH